MNNMKVLQNNTYNDMLENSLVYIMDNSSFYRNQQFLFNITGEIEDPQPKLENKNITLLINLENENDEKTEVEVQCNIIIYYIANQMKHF